MNILERIDTVLNEGTWSVPNTHQKAKSLQKIMSKKMTKKDIDKLNKLIGDDDFYDELDDAIRNDTSDIRNFIATWLEDNWLKNSDIKWEGKSLDIIKQIITKYRS